MEEDYSQSSESSEPTQFNYAQIIEQNKSEPAQSLRQNEQMAELVEAFKVRDEEEEKLLNRSKDFNVETNQASAIAWKVILKGEDLNDFKFTMEYFRFPIEGVFEESLEAGYGLIKNNKNSLVLRSLQFLEAFNSALNQLWDNQCSPNLPKFLYLLGEGTLACFQNFERPQVSLMTSDKRLWEYFMKDTTEEVSLLSTGKQFCMNTVKCEEINKAVSKLTGLAAEEDHNLEIIANYPFESSKLHKIKSKHENQREIRLTGPLFGEIFQRIEGMKKEMNSGIQLEIQWIEESRWLGLAHPSSDEMEFNEKYLSSKY